MSSQNDVLDDLVTLRKGRGLSIDRLLRSGALVAALGGRDQPPDTLWRRLVSAIDSLDDVEDKEALRAAFGILEVTKGLQRLLDRRQAYGRLVHRTPDTLLDWEDRALTALSLRLLTNYYAGAPIDHRFPIPHGGFLLGDLTVSTLIRDRHFVEQEQHRTVISLVKDARGFQYNTNNVESELGSLEGARVETEHINGGSAHRIYFTPHPLELGQVHHFRFTERSRHPSDPDAPAANPDKAGQAFETPTLRYSQTVKFEGDTPEELWSYTNLSLLERPGRSSKGQILSLDTHKCATSNFSQLYGGLYSGIAWAWSANQARPSTRHNNPSLE